MIVEVGCEKVANLLLQITFSRLCVRKFVYESGSVDFSQKLMLYGILPRAQHRVYAHQSHTLQPVLRHGDPSVILNYLKFGKWPFPTTVQLVTIRDKSMRKAFSTFGKADFKQLSVISRYILNSELSFQQLRKCTNLSQRLSCNLVDMTWQGLLTSPQSVLVWTTVRDEGIQTLRLPSHKTFGVLRGQEANCQ